MSTPENIISLKFVVVGGSIAGLSAAYMLAFFGHKVVVLEEQEKGVKRDGALRCPPNMAKLFHGIPEADELFARACRCASITCRDGRTCNLLGKMVFHPDIMKEFGSEYFVTTYSDLHHFLETLCNAVGVEIRYGTSAHDAERTKDGVAVHTKDEVFHADLLIAADGRNSFLRPIIAEDDMVCTAEVFGASFKVPLSQVEKDEDFKFFLDASDEWQAYAGNDSILRISCHPTRDEMHVSILASPNGDHTDCEDDFYKTYPLPPIDVSGYDKRLQKLWSLGAEAGCHPILHKIYEVEEWIGLEGRGVLAGDAAHSSLIHGSYNASVAVEDGGTIGKLFSYITSKRQIPFLLSAYQEIRQPRNTSTQNAEYAGFMLGTVPPGEAQRARDAAMAATLMVGDDFDFEEDGLLAQVWSEYIESYSYDPSDAVDEWWATWGRKIQEYV